MDADSPAVSYLFYHVGGVVSDQILRRIDGAQDVGHLDLEKEGSGGRSQAGGSERVKGARVLTGRSLDVLCSCLMLWLRVLCDKHTHHTTVPVYATTRLLPR